MAKSIIELEIRAGEKAVDSPLSRDATLIFIGRIETPWRERSACPRQGAMDGPICHLMVDDIWAEALTGIEQHRELQVLYWMDRARRDLVLLAPRSHPEPTGTFALRAPTRPNPIASSIVALVERQGSTLLVRGLDCLSGTPLLDIKPWRSPDGRRTKVVNECDPTQTRDAALDEPRCDTQS